MINFAAITPHPPIIIPGIGKGRDLELVSQTIQAMEELGKELEKEKVDVVLVICPHAPAEFSSFGINFLDILRGSLNNFGLDKDFQFKNEQELARKIHKECTKAEINTHFYEYILDHSALVPLYYLTKNIKVELIHLSFSFMDFETHYNYGKIIRSVCLESSKKIAIIASGDLSHRLIPSAPAGYSPQGEVFDKKLIDLLRQGKVKEIINIDRNLVEEAGECGLRSFIILLGILGSRYNFRLLGHEVPFGVGYLTARLL